MRFRLKNELKSYIRGIRKGYNPTWPLFYFCVTILGIDLFQIMIDPCEIDITVLGLNLCVWKEGKYDHLSTLEDLVAEIEREEANEQEESSHGEDNEEAGLG